MLKIKKISKVMLVVFIMTIVLTVLSSASNSLVYDLGNGYLSSGITNYEYKKSWEAREYFDNDRGIMDYGFNTFLFNEDYCKSLHTTQRHQSLVGNNNNGWVFSGEVGPGEWTPEASKGHVASPVWETDYY